MHTMIFILALVTVLFALVSKKIRFTVVSPPMLFTTVGALIALTLDAGIEEEQAREMLEIIAELTLVLVLFTDASRIRLPLLIKDYQIPVRLLGIGLPLTIVLGFMIAGLFFSDFSFWELALLSAILAPTDAALGQAVVSSPRVPEKIRQSLNVESGLNDGIVLPLVILCATLASTNTESSVSSLLNYWVAQITLGPLAGILVGWIGGLSLEKAKELGWIDSTFEQLSGAALALLAWSAALIVGGNGFIAAFVAGITMSCFADKIGEAMREFGEAEGQWLSLATFLLFGIVFVVPVLKSFQWIYLVYALLSLTVIRMIPVAVSIIGTGLHGPTYWFLGWFGPRGLATLLFALLVVGKCDLEHGQQIFEIGMTTFLLSLFAHGASAVPGVSWYVARLKSVCNSESLENQSTVKHQQKFSLLKN